jgi:hypothetical protein
MSILCKSQDKLSYAQIKPLIKSLMQFKICNGNHNHVVFVYSYYMHPKSIFIKHYVVTWFQSLKTVTKIFQHMNHAVKI